MTARYAASDSPHAADARDKILEAQDTGSILAALRAVTNAILAVADELDETRRQQHSDAIDLGNAVAGIAGIAGILDDPGRGTVTKAARWRRLRQLFGGAR